jgi:flagellar hook-basal body protein
MKALQIAATGMAAQQMKVDVVSNNLANMSTTGYNPRRADFADLTYQQMARPGSVSAADGSMLPTGVQIGLGVRPAAVSVVVGQGTLEATGGDLDIAIDGNGYIEVQMPSGQTGYTRDGALKRSAEGLIVTSDGFPVVPGITIGCARTDDQPLGRGLGRFRRPGRSGADRAADLVGLSERKGVGGDRVEPIPRKPGFRRGFLWHART